ncbi:carbamoyltransferase C-terminal domain-containing protein [Streptomyces sp. NPDC053048]|uniref:carbamoyltransferase C-terminal domain-containing protein n=1 Tax=Streptomyces sp. NPDC053048 TaxID=3365694 RepID=UPI0037CE0638
MKVLSLHSLGHDSGVAYFEDGRLVHSMETERLTRWKHDHRIALALRYILSRPDVDADGIDLVAVSSPVRDSVLRIPDLDRAMAAVNSGAPHYRTTCDLLGRTVDCVIVTHEVSHAALALQYAGHPEGCLVLTNEGRGQISHSSLFRYAEGRLEWIETEPLPWYGTGFGWSAFGYLYGFGKGPSVAGKVMALGGYGQPSAAIREILEGIDDRILTDRALAERVGAELMTRPEFGADFQQRADCIASLQQMFTESVYAGLAKHIDAAGRDDVPLALGGGCALNVVANAHLRKRFNRDIAIPPACGDAGHPLGAGVYAQRFLYDRPVEPFGVYLNGQAETEEEIRGTIMAAALDPLPYEPDAAVRVLAGGGVVAMVGGPSESGPRALGNRSLLGSPDVAGMRERLSERLKEREWFRPLGAVMRTEDFRQRFPGEPPSPYMLFNYDVPEGLIPEARHVDGTSRLQTVSHDQNPRLHHLLAEFERATGTPALINTSLNARGRAIAHRAHDALLDFRERDVDLFVLGDLMAYNGGRARPPR